MARVLLVSANRTREPYPVFPLGVLMVVDATRRAGHEIAAYDALSESLWETTRYTDGSLEQALERFSPEIIGLSIRNIDNADAAGLEAYGDDYVRLARRIRQSSPGPLVLGGPGFSLVPDALMAALGADYGVVGEGERAFPWLVHRLAAGAPPLQRLLRGEAFGLVQQDGLLAPERPSQAAALYLREGGMLNLQTKRGCPLRCAYCTYPALEGRGYRTRDPEAVADEVEMLRDRYGAAYVAFVDAVFNDEAGHYLEVAEALARRNTGVRWMAFFRPAPMTASETGLLRRSGLAAVELGTDATTDATLEGLQKNFRWSDVAAAQDAFAAAGIPVAHFVMFGGPGETEETVRKGLANLERLERCVVFAFAGVRVLPATALHARAVEENVVSADDNLLASRFYVAPGLEAPWIEACIAESFRGRLDRVFPASRDADRVRALRALGRQGPLWDMLLGGSVTGRRRL